MASMVYPHYLCRYSTNAVSSEPGKGLPAKWRARIYKNWIDVKTMLPILFRLHILGDATKELDGAPQPLKRLGTIAIVWFAI